MDDTPPFYRGHEGSAEVLADKRLARPGRAIRVYHNGFSGDEPLYVIGTEGKLFDAKTGAEVKAENVFSNESAPHGWSVEGLELALLPEAEILKILKRA